MFYIEVNNIFVDGWIHLSTNSDGNPFLSKQVPVSENFPPTHIGFGRSGFVKYARVLFDCPFTKLKFSSRSECKKG